MEKACIVLTTISSRDEAEILARSLVEARLAACVNILGGVRSIYRWQGAVEEADEVQLVIKTSVEKLDALEPALKAAHPYQVPEFIVLPVKRGSSGYLHWIDESVE